MYTYLYEYIQFKGLFFNQTLPSISKQQMTYKLTYYLIKFVTEKSNLKGFSSLGFAQSTCFSKYYVEVVVALSSTNVIKTSLPVYLSHIFLSLCFALLR